MSTEKSPASEHDCTDCPLADRRTFLADALRAAAGVAVALGIGPTRAAALPLRLMSALSSDGGEKRYPLPPGDTINFDKDAEVILVRHERYVYAFALSCPHQKTSLRWRDDDGIFQCPKHKSKYRPDGTFIDGKATRGMDRYAVRSQAGKIVVDTERLFKQDEDPTGWARAVVEVG